MKRGWVLIVAGFLVAFGLGLGVGTQFYRRATSGEVRAFREQPGEAWPSAVANTPPPCVDIRHAGSLVGKSGCVTAIVLRVYSARSGNTFLDFCEDYRTCPFSSVIFASDTSKFGNLGALQGRRVEIRGEIVAYQGRAEIVIRDPQQVRSAR
jgi:hypothetical protein